LRIDPRARLVGEPEHAGAAREIEAQHQRASAGDLFGSVNAHGTGPDAAEDRHARPEVQRLADAKGSPAAAAGSSLPDTAGGGVNTTQRRLPRHGRRAQRDRYGGDSTHEPPVPTAAPHSVEVQ
jgi:hypothetical protein